MADLKLAKLPDRTPLKLTISISPDLNQALKDYGRLYAASYGREEPMTELIPAIVASFLESDSAFQHWRRASREVEPTGRIAASTRTGSTSQGPIEPLTMRIPEAARALSISRSSLYRLIGSGDIETAKNGHKILVIVASLRAFVERHRVQATSVHSTSG